MNDDLLPHLDTFARAAELGNFTGAAKATGLSQAAVSLRVQALEKELGVSLFTRHGGHVALTEAGRLLYGYAQRILALHREARQEVTGRPTTVTGDLSLAASSVPGEHLLPGLLDAFRRKQPHVRVSVAVADTAAVLGQVEEGKAHLGLVGGKSDNAHLEYRCFACDTLVLVVPAGHAWGKRHKVSLEQLFGEPLILREPGSGSRWCLEEALARAGRRATDLRVVLELGSNEAIKESVQRGMGLAILSARAVEKAAKRGGPLRALKVEGLSLEREMFVVWDRRRVLPIPARLFLDLLEPCARTPRH
jgi:DNA-binding transcriptional LysR family regulator